MKVFVIIITQENTLRFTFMSKEHGFLHDKKRKQSYAVVRDAYQTNWKGRFGVAYIVRELDAQSVRVDETEATKPAGTVAFEPVVRMRAKIPIPGANGEEAEIHLSAEGIFDKVLSLQVRRMSNRKYSFVMAALLVSFGLVLGTVFGLTISLLSSHGAQPAAAQGAPVILTPGGNSGSPQSGPANPTIIVQHANGNGAPNPGGG